VYPLAGCAVMNTREEAEEFLNDDLASRRGGHTFPKNTTKSRILDCSSPLDQLSLLDQSRFTISGIISVDK
jgi:hypothetical protein